MAMFPPLFDKLKGVAAVKAIFGTSPRIFPHGMVPAAGSTGFATPYAVQQIVTGSPENFLWGRPDVDGYMVQVDVYGATVAAASDGAKVLRDALEPFAYITRWGGQFKDPDTNLFRYSFDVEFLTSR